MARTSTSLISRLMASPISPLILSTLLARKLPPAAVATHLTISSLSGNMGHFGYKRIAVCLYHRTSGTFWTYDDPTTVWPKMGFLNLRVPGGLGGASVWTLKDGDAHGTIVKTIAVGLR